MSEVLEAIFVRRAIKEFDPLPIPREAYRFYWVGDQKRCRAPLPGASPRQSPSMSKVSSLSTPLSIRRVK